MPAHAMRLSSVLDYMFVRVALDGELTEYALRYLFFITVCTEGVTVFRKTSYTEFHQAPSVTHTHGRST